MPRETLNLPVTGIIADAAVQIRRSNRENAIKRYMDCFEYLPPIVVYRTPEGLLLADGFHRLAAAQRLGMTEIRAEVREGTRSEALEYAVVANATSGEPLTDEERDDGIRRMRQLHPDYSLRRVADLMGTSRSTVHRVWTAEDFRTKVLWKPATRIPDHIIAEVAQAPEECWRPLIQVVDRQRWQREEIRMAVRLLNSDAVPQADKQRLLAGDVRPGELKAPVTDVPLLKVDFDPDVEVAAGDQERAVMLEPRRPAPLPDPVGDDLAERLYPVRVRFELEYVLSPETPDTRHRGIRVYARGQEQIRRSCEIVLNKEYLERPVYELVQAVAQRLLRTLSYEGFPRQVRESEQGVRT